MNINKFDDPGIADQIVALFRSGNLIPFFGTGFTRGCRAKKGTVPDANELSKQILKLASESQGLSATDKAEILRISDLKTAFSLLKDETYVEPAQAKKLLESMFSAVSVPSDGRREILQLPWPHIFTFNIDDAIESSTKQFKKILPNRTASLEYLQANRCLFKFHGDIDEFIQYEDTNLIFTWMEYIDSIDKNRSLITYFESIAQRSSYLFIGCSLDAEIDLMHVSKKTQFVNSIYLKKGPPSVTEKLNLKNYGIGQVVYFDDYETIYTWLRDILHGIEIEERIEELEFLTEPTDKNGIIRYIASGGPVLHRGDKNQLAVRTPGFISTRLTVQKIRSTLVNEDFVVLRGKRFSGKTTALIQLYRDLNHYSGYFFASQDNYYPGIRNIMAGVDNSLFIFDSNFLDGESLKEILNTTLAKGSKIVLCCNNSDFAFFQRRLEDKNVEFVDIEFKNSLLAEESKATNKVLNKLGLPEFKTNETLLSAAYRYYDNFDSITKNSLLFSKNIDRITFEVLFVIAAFGKLSSLTKDAAFKSINIKEFLKSHDALFELENSGTLNEVVLCNSSTWLINAIRKFIQDNRSTSPSYVAGLIIAMSQNGAKSAANSLLRFDKLNEIVSEKGDAVFIREVYKALEESYESVPHYWLQLAKLELIAARKLSEIRDGISHAKKVRIDQQAKQDSTYFSATLTLAQLCGREYIETNDTDCLIQMMKYYKESFDNYENNKRHLDEIREKYKSRKHVHKALEALFTSTNTALLPHKRTVDSLRASITV